MVYGDSLFYKDPFFNGNVGAEQIDKRNREMILYLCGIKVIMVKYG